METCFLQHLSISKQPRECQNRCWLTLDKGQLPISILHQFERIQAMTDACHYTLNFPENLDIKVIIVKILMSISIISTKTSSIWLRCNVGLFPKSHFIKQSINHFQLKAALIGALFLVDFMYGEKPKWLSKEMNLYIPSPEIYTLHKLAITESNYIQKKYWYQNINTDDNLYQH